MCGTVLPGKTAISSVSGRPLHERAPGMHVVDVRELEIMTVCEALVVRVARHATAETEEHELVVGCRLRKAVDLEEPTQRDGGEIEHADPGGGR